jgi:hypothetical protein
LCLSKLDLLFSSLCLGLTIYHLQSWSLLRER